jgi:sulfhydrogenase subunit beta (sulfur reductase)
VVAAPAETVNRAIDTERAYVIEAEQMQDLVDVLRRRGYQVLGPIMRDGAIIYDEIETTNDLPTGWTDEQSGGTYRLERRNDNALFGYTLGPHSWKKYLNPPTQRLWHARREGNGFKLVDEPVETVKRALIGVRSCELHAISIQDRVFLGEPGFPQPASSPEERRVPGVSQGGGSGREYADPNYKAQRDGLFIVAVNCGQAGGTCFCTSMGTGPKATSGYDLALTEVLENKRHYFVVEVGSELGAEVLAEVPCSEASAREVRQAEEIVAKTAGQMGRSMDTAGLKELLYASYDHPHWDEVAARCLTCGNCTMVCPTCFCTTLEDTTDLTGEQAERWRRWDSCFTTDFSYIHGGSVRPSPKSRYRQWITHKLASWQDQFGTSGCVGCGRCITWCPVGIDITQEARAIREGPMSSVQSPNQGG